MADFDGRKKTQANWDKWTKEVSDAAKEITEEAVKGPKADTAQLAKLLGRMEKNCIDCHNAFRAD